MTVNVDPVVKLEHDHVHLTRLVDGLRDAIHDALRDDTDPQSLKDDFREFLAVLGEELFEHFDREEQALFPYIVEALADTRNQIESLERGHDRICGIAARMDRMVHHDEDAFGENFDSLVALFTRFDANYVKHAQAEAVLLRSLGNRLTDEQRAKLAELLDAL